MVSEIGSLEVLSVPKLSPVTLAERVLREWFDCTYPEVIRKGDDGFYYVLDPEGHYAPVTQQWKPMALDQLLTFAIEVNDMMWTIAEENKSEEDNKREEVKRWSRFGFRNIEYPDPYMRELWRRDSVKYENRDKVLREMMTEAYKGVTEAYAI